MTENISEINRKNRLLSFQKPFDPHEYKSNNKNNSVELRKSKRLNEVSKKRNIEIFDKSWIDVNNHYKQVYTLQDLPLIIESIHTNDDQKSLFSAQALRKILSTENPDYIQDIIDSGVINFILSFLNRHDFTQLQYESVWILTNITSGEHKYVMYLIEKGVIQMLIKLLSSEVEELRDQVAWCIGNISADSDMCRDLILESNVLPYLYRNLTENPSQVSIWTFTNICRTKPAPDYASIKPFISILSKLLLTTTSEDSITEIL